MVETHLSQRKDEEKGGEKQPTATAGADSAKLQTSDPYETFGYEVFPERDTTKSRYLLKNLRNVEALPSYVSQV